MNSKVPMLSIQSTSMDHSLSFSTDNEIEAAGADQEPLR